MDGSWSGQQDTRLRGNLGWNWLLSLLLVWVERETDLVLIPSLPSVGWQDHPILHSSILTLALKKAARPWIKLTSTMVLLVKGWPFRSNAHIVWQFLVHDILNSNFIDGPTRELESKWWHAMIAMSHFASAVTSHSTVPMILIWSKQILKMIGSLLSRALSHHHLRSKKFNFKQNRFNFFYSYRRKYISHTVFYVSLLRVCILNLFFLQSILLVFIYPISIIYLVKKNILSKLRLYA